MSLSDTNTDNAGNTAAKVRQLLGSDAMRVVVDKLDRRLGRRQDLDGTISLRQPPRETLDAVTSLLGILPRGDGDLRVQVSDLDRALRNATDVGLFDSLCIVLGRPPCHPAEETRRRRDDWRTMVDEVRVAFLADHPNQIQVADVVTEILSSSTMKRLAQSNPVTARVWSEPLLRTLCRLPLVPPLPLPVLAAQLTGDSHALDVGTPLYTLLTSALTRSDVPTDELSCRERFSRVGIVVDELSSTALVLNVRPIGESFLANMLRQAADAGEPVRVTFRQIRRCGVSFSSSHDLVSVCENPAVVATAADVLGADCRPLICVEGQSSHAANELFGAFAAAGVEMRYHGDFDPPGLKIASRMIEQFQMRPWRMTAGDYRRSSDPTGLTLAKHVSVPPTPWDPNLATELQTIRRIVLEEQVLADLLSDL